MEIQLQELIEQIKKDGVQAAEAQAEAILTAAKAEAIRKTVMGPIDESCPASILRTHNNVILYIDTDSASLL